LVLKTVIDRTEIDKNQNEFRELFVSKATKMVEGSLGYKGGEDYVKMYWIEDLRIWGVFQQVENRYWNAFGDQDPTYKNDRSIIVEINFPFKNPNSRIAGLFAHDETGDVIVLHRGLIGGGQKGFGKKVFFENYLGDYIEIEENKQRKFVAQIGKLESKDFVLNLKKFVTEVKRIKQKIKSQQ